MNITQIEYCSLCKDHPTYEGNHVKATHIQKYWFQNGIWKAKVKEFWPSHVPNFKELGSRLVPFLGGQNHPFSTPIRFHMKAKILLPWLPELHFDPGMFERLWPPFMLANPSVGSCCVSLQAK